MLGHDLRGARLGIVGLGGIGSRVAHRGRAPGMEIAYTSRSESPQAAAPEATRLDLDELLATADVVDGCGEEFAWEAIGERTLRGVAAPVPVIRLIV
jgi:lactate dehydrogenase-like 2-hydroxyacid dehydrogenase